jgi:hypothetical protein
MTGKELFEQISAEIKEIHPSFSVRFKNESKLMRLLTVLMYPFNDRFMNGFVTTLGSAVYFPSLKLLKLRWRDYARVLAHERVHIWDGEQRPLRFNLGYAFPQWLAVIGLAAFAVLGSWIPLAVVAGGAVVSYLALWLTMKATESMMADSVKAKKAKKIRLGVFFPLIGLSVVAFAVLAVWLSGWWAFLAGGALVPLAPWRAYWRAESEYRGYAMGIAISYWKYGFVPLRLLENRVPTFTGMNYYRMDPSKERVLKRLLAIEESCKNNRILTGPNARPYQRVFDVLKRSGLAKFGEISA